MTAPRLAFENGKLILRDGKAGTEQECCCGGGGVCPPGDGCGIGAGFPCVPYRGPYLTEQEAQQAGDDWVAEHDAFFESVMRPALEAAGYTNIQAGGEGVTYNWCEECPDEPCLDENNEPFGGPLYSVQLSWDSSWDCGECNSGTVDPEDLECQDWTQGPFVSPNEEGDYLSDCNYVEDQGAALFCVPRCNPFP